MKNFMKEFFGIMKKIKVPKSTDIGKGGVANIPSQNFNDFEQICTQGHVRDKSRFLESMFT